MIFLYKRNYTTIVLLFEQFMMVCNWVVLLVQHYLIFIPDKKNIHGNCKIQFTDDFTLIIATNLADLLNFAKRLLISFRK